MFPAQGRRRDHHPQRRRVVVPFLLVCGVLLVTYPPGTGAAQVKSRTSMHASAPVRDEDPRAKAKRRQARNTLVCVVNIVNNQKVNNVQRVVTVQNNKQKVVTVEKVVVVPHYVTVTKVVYVPRYITKVVYVHDPAPTATPYNAAANAYNAAVAQYNPAMAPYATPTPYAAPTPTDTPVPYPPVAYP